MPTFLSDPPRVLFLLLLAAVVISGALAFRRQDRKSLIAFAISAILLVALWLISTLTESPREEAERRIQAMAKAAHEKNGDAFVAHAADTVEYNGGSGARKLTREQVRTMGLWNLLKRYDVEVSVWDFDREQVKEISPTEIEIGFAGQGKVQGTPIPYYFRAVFAKQANGEYRLTKLSSYDYVKRTELKAIPNFP